MKWNFPSLSTSQKFQMVKFKVTAFFLSSIIEVQFRIWSSNKNQSRSRYVPFFNLRLAGFPPRKPAKSWLKFKMTLVDLGWCYEASTCDSSCSEKLVLYSFPNLFTSLCSFSTTHIVKSCQYTGVIYFICGTKNCVHWLNVPYIYFVIFFLFFLRRKSVIQFLINFSSRCCSSYTNRM